MRIVCIGGGPSGLYFSILMKLADPTHDITVLERNRPDDTFGFGVVFSDATLDNLREADPETHREILASFRGFLQGLTSFESATYSTTKLLDKASQARDLYYQALELRGPVKSLSRWIGREESSERSGQARDIVVERKAYENALNALRAELQRHTQGLHDAFIILQETAADAKVKLDLVQDEVTKERYPAAWADENRKEIAPVRTMIDDLVQDEIRQSRVLLSEIERAQG